MTIDKEDKEYELYNPDNDAEINELYRKMNDLYNRVIKLETAMEKGTEILLMHAQAINIISAHLGKQEEVKKNDKKIIR